MFVSSFDYVVEYLTDFDIYAAVYTRPHYVSPKVKINLQ